MIAYYFESREELLEFIRISTRSQMEDSATRDGILYQEIPFPGYETVRAQRENSAQRVRIIAEHVSFSGKTVLDIGCNIGYFCFEFARRGALCWGVDDDPKTICIARSLKHIHHVDNVHFHQGELSEATIDYLLVHAGHFDVVLLNSVAHWLINSLGSVGRLIRLLNLLHSSMRQVIVYEPSSASGAYYPEELTTANIEAFFFGLGAHQFKKIGETFASNINDKREIWLGVRSASDSTTPNEMLPDSWNKRKVDASKVCYTEIV